ncbi:hypothetical protein [Nocardia niwae]|uniref:Gp37-like protein n=1 Tax=Nocardia niwae TaxID=626084 RepID=UPI000B1F9EA9|nr:hypothetical protein [Nocardia niwae]
MTDLSTLSLKEQCEEIWKATLAAEEEDRRARLVPPKIRIWTGDWNLVDTLDTEYSASFTWLDNEVGPGLTEIPLDDPLAKWIWQVAPRVARGEKLHVFITVDKDGARWSGRLHDHTVEKREDGTWVLVVRWLHDMSTLEHYLVWCNSFLPAFVQFPRVFFLAGPSIWGLKTALFLQIMRENATSNFALPDDPQDQSSAPATMMSNWPVAIKPTTFMDDLNAGTIWSVPNSRFKRWVDMAKDILEDAQLSIQVRRFIAGEDEQPIEGQTLRNGCLVVDIVDKSGYYTDTSNGGDPFLGLRRTFAQFAEDFVDAFEEDVVSPTVPDSYMVPGLRLTDKTCPYVIYLEGEETGIESSKFTFTPSTARQIVAGGHSFPFVNELISAAIQCVSGDTVIDGPDGGERIDVLAKRGGPFRIWSVTPSGERVAATAQFAFKKGRAELFRYTLANGCALTATARHRWLTRDGWTYAGDAPIGTEVASADLASRESVNEQPSEDIPDEAWIGVEDGNAVSYSRLISVESVGVRDFYDMRVPGWVNYSAERIFSHNTAGDLLAAAIVIPPIGGALDAVAQIFYWDTIAAWASIESTSRKTNGGWAAPFEVLASGSDRAYTLEMLLSIRKSLHETRSWFSHEINIRDGAPWFIGDNGKGHFFIGDRIGAQVIGTQVVGNGPTVLYVDDHTIYVDRVRELTLAWDRESPPEWVPVIGEKEKNKDRGQRALAQIAELGSLVQQLAVHGR